MEAFTPISATIGGALIGAAAVLLMAFNGRIAGISGILSGALFSGASERAWRLWFLGGLIAAPLAVRLVSGAPAFDMNAGPAAIVIGGLLVGYGTRLGSGCTSGHGVCGLSRLSPRSAVAVGAFMAAGMATVAAIRFFAGG